LNVAKEIVSDRKEVDEHKLKAISSTVEDELKILQRQEEIMQRLEELQVNNQKKQANSTSKLT